MASAQDLDIDVLLLYPIHPSVFACLSIDLPRFFMDTSELGSESDLSLRGGSYLG